MIKMLKKLFLLLSVTSTIAISIIVCDITISKDNHTTYAEPTTLTLGEDAQAEKASSLVEDAIQALFANSDGVVEIASIFKSVFSGVGMVNSGITFLKLTGIMKDGTAQALANIQRQLETLSERVAIMDAKLDGIIKKMEEMHADQDFIDRTTNARDYRSYYRQFKFDYCTNSLDKYITQFEAMRINAIKNWYNSDSAEARQDTIDNSQIILIYDLVEKDGNQNYELRYTLSNDIPTDENTRYIKFSSAFLPTKNDVAAWDANNFRKEISNYVKGKINTIPDELEYSDDFPELTDTFINDIVADIVNLLIFRTTAITINEDANYPLSVLKAFKDYVEILNESETGYAALIKALYYSHSFEYEISDSINERCAELIFETAYYGSFVKDILAMSKDIENEKKDEFDKLYVKSINKLDDTRSKALTGKPNYCYITNTLLYYGYVDVNASAKIEYYEKGGTKGYMSYAGKGFDVGIKRYNENSELVGTYSKNQMIGKHDATLISMTLRSNGIIADHNYLAEKLSGAKNAKNTGVILVEMKGESDLPFDSTTPLKVKKVIGDYFTDGSNVSMRYLPSKTSTDYVTWHKEIKGTIFDFAAGNLESDASIASIATYGESHWFWNVDEAVFMSGSPSKVVTRNNNTRTISHKNAEKMVYIMDYEFASSYNCILEEPLTPSLNENADELNPLYSYRVANNYVDPDPAEPIEAPSESSAIVKEDNEEAIQKAILLIPSIYAAIIIIPCIFGGIIIISLTVCIIFYFIKKKKNII